MVNGIMDVKVSEVLDLTVETERVYKRFWQVGQGIVPGLEKGLGTAYPAGLEKGKDVAAPVGLERSLCGAIPDIEHLFHFVPGFYPGFHWDYGAGNNGPDLASQEPAGGFLGVGVVCLLSPGGKMAYRGSQGPNTGGGSFPHFHKVFHIYTHCIDQEIF